MDINRRRRASIGWLADAVITMAAVLLAYAAFDDITTDNATSFTFEYAGLAVCGAWLLVLALRLIREGRLALGGISLLALAGAVWGQRAIGPGTVPSVGPHYLATVGAFGWFAVLSVILLVVEWRAHPERQAQTAMWIPPGDE